MTGLELLPLRQRLSQDFGLETHQFHYSSWFGDEAGTAARLAALAHSLSAPVHFLGHSLGGLLILDLFERQGVSLPAGRVVLMGSPVNGAEVARTLSGWPGMRKLLGAMPHRQLVEAPRRVWRQSRYLGVIAGTIPLGLGLVAGGFEGPNDGTVQVAETLLEGRTAMVTLPVTHAGMGLPKEVSHHAGTFLTTGQFA
jgi:pimeloyl-ACP methyl ester carboxylesterase